MTQDRKPIVVIGAGGYAQEVAWIIDDLNSVSPEWHFLGFIDPLESGLAEHYGRPVLSGYAAVRSLCAQPFFACGMGTPSVRCKEAAYAEDLGWVAATLIHPSVIRAQYVSTGEGSVVGAGTVLAPNASIGRHCAINVQATIGHNAAVGDFSVISPGARILGRVAVEDKVFVGANASVYPGRRLGSGSTLGANSFLHKDLLAGQSALGVMARPFLPASAKETS